MWPKFARLNTLRNQMLFGFLLVMMIILTLVGAATFGPVSTMLKKNAEKHIQQTAIQANGRLEGILGQIDSLTTLVSTNAYVQKLLLRELNGQPATFAERQALAPIINIVQIYASGIKSVELYSQDRRKLFPLDEGDMGEKVNEAWIAEAKASKGSIVWFGIDPQDSNAMFAIRQVSLMDQNFSTGGYLLVRTDRHVFAFKDPPSFADEQETMLLVGADGQLLASNNANISEADAFNLVAANLASFQLGKQSYIVVQQKSSLTGWTLLILTPLHTITQGITVLRTSILVSAGIGTLLFILLSFLLSTIITRPIFKLIKTMRGARIGVIKPNANVSSTIEINELNYTYNQMVENINELIRLVYEKEILQSQTELKALQAQINPHFLYNTLEALYWSLMDKEEEELADFVVAMSDLFRYTITGSNKEQWVTLYDELEHTEKYLLIMKLRFGERLSWTINTSSDFDSIKMPKLLIQPFVENAILHGLERKIGSGIVNVRVHRTGDGEDLVITVEDDGAGIEEEALQKLQAGLKKGNVPSSKKSGMGLINVQRRISLFFESDPSDADSILITSRLGVGTNVQIRIPIKEEYDAS